MQRPFIGSRAIVKGTRYLYLYVYTHHTGRLSNDRSKNAKRDYAMGEPFLSATGTRHTICERGAIELSLVRLASFKLPDGANEERMELDACSLSVNTSDCW